MVKLPAISTEAASIKSHGHNVLKISELFAKLCSILKVDPKAPEATERHGRLPPSLECYADTFDPCSTSYQDPLINDEDVRVWAKSSKRVSSKNVVFLWGFQSGISTAQVKNLLYGKHEVFSSEFDIRLVDESCAVLVFSSPGLSEILLEALDSGNSLKDMASEGIRAASYDTYIKVCQLELWKGNLADSLELAMEEESECLSEAHTAKDLSLIHWNSDEMINLDDL